MTEQLYAAQGEGVPKMFRPGFRTMPSGELAQVGQDGQLKPLGVSATTGDRMGAGSGDGFSGGGGGGEAADR